MRLSDSLHGHIAAAFTGIRILLHEHEDAPGDIGRLCAERDWPLPVWDIDRGLQVRGQVVATVAGPVAAIKPIAALVDVVLAALEAA